LRRKLEFMGKLIVRRVIVSLFVLAISNAASAATPFLWQPGTSNNGLYAPSLTLMTTELNSLASGSVAVSSVGGTSGVFSNANTGQVIWSPMMLTIGFDRGGVSNRRQFVVLVLAVA
jgi:hypothetical protein